MEFIISHTDEVLVSHSYLALAGALLQQSPIGKRLSELSLGKVRGHEMPLGDVVLSMIGLLYLGETDYVDMEAHRREKFFRRALGLANFPSDGCR